MRERPSAALNARKIPCEEAKEENQNFSVCRATCLCLNELGEVRIPDASATCVRALCWIQPAWRSAQEVSEGCHPSLTAGNRPQL